MPINYDLGIIKEHLHVRSSAGIFDVSHMGQILVLSNVSNIIKLEKFVPLILKNLRKLFDSRYKNLDGKLWVQKIILKKYLQNN